MKIKTFMPFAVAAIVVGISAIFGFSRVAHAVDPHSINMVAQQATVQHRVALDQNQNDPNAINPTITTNPASYIDLTTAQLNAYYDHGNTYSNVAVTYFQYGTSSSNLVYATDSRNRPFYDHAVVSYVENLTPNTTYYYRVVMQYHGVTTYGSIVSFTTVAQQAPAAPTVPVTNTTGSNSNNSSSHSSNSNSKPAKPVELSTVSNAFAKLSITDEETTIGHGDLVTYKVTYEARQKLNDAKLVIKLPKGMVIKDTSTGTIDKGDATVTVDLKDLKAGKKKTIEIEARLNKNYRDGAAIKSTAKLSFETESGSARTMTATDTTEFSGNSGFGASIFGAGVSINFFHWVLIIIIIAGVIIIARKQFHKAQ